MLSGVGSVLGDTVVSIAICSTIGSPKARSISGLVEFFSRTFHSVSALVELVDFCSFAASRDDGSGDGNRRFGYGYWSRRSKLIFSNWTGALVGGGALCRFSASCTLMAKSIVTLCARRIPWRHPRNPSDPQVRHFLL